MSISVCHCACALQWVSDSRPHSRTASLKVDANKFAPQGANPHELRDKVLEVNYTFYRMNYIYLYVVWIAYESSW